MKHDLTTGTWQDDTGCPISFVLAATSDGGGETAQEYAHESPPRARRQPKSPRCSTPAWAGSMLLSKGGDDCMCS